MYMRYAGGGVGHYRVTLTDTPANANEIQEDFAVEDDVTADHQRLLSFSHDFAKQEYTTYFGSGSKSALTQSILHGLA